MRRAFLQLWYLVTAVILMFATSPAQAGVKVLTYHNDVNRTGWNPAETILSPANVTPTTFGLKTTVPLDGLVDAQPLVVSNLRLLSSRHKTILYAVTENDTVYAIDGDPGSGTFGTALLQNHLGTPVARGNCGHSSDTEGILGTPTIDRTNKWLFLVALQSVNGTPTYVLHRLSLNLTETLGSPVVINPTMTLADGSAYSFQSNIVNLRQRPGLLEANGNVYAAFGGCGDRPTARGWILGWNISTLAPIGNGLMTNTIVTGNPVEYLSSVWMSGYGLAADAAGNVYAATGNSNNLVDTYQPDQNVPESVLKIAPNLQAIDDLFTDPNHFFLDQNDKDLGSGGVMLIPGTTLAIGGGKTGDLYIMNVSGPNTMMNATSVKMGPCWCGESYYTGSDGIGRVVTGAGGPNGTTVVRTWTVNSQNTVPLTSEAVSGSAESSPDDPGMFTSISSNGTVPNSQIIWGVGRPASTDGHLDLWAYNGTPAIGSLNTLVELPAGSWKTVTRNYNGVPAVANGIVAVGSDNALSIFGSLP